MRNNATVLHLNCGYSKRPLVISPRRNDPARVAYVVAIKTWARAVSGVDESTTVMVTELACSEPGCPPLETVIAVLRGKDDRITWKLHKAMLFVSESDVREGFARLGRSGVDPSHSP
jgi:hypothetical protein